MKKTITLLLVSTMLLSALSACGETPAQTADAGNTPEITDPAAAETEASVEEETKLTANLPDVNYDGYTFTILTLDNYTNQYHLNTEEMTGEPLNDSTYERNAKIAEDIGVEISSAEFSELVGPLQTAVAAGDTTYDLVLPHPNANAGLTSLVSADLLYNLREIPVVDWEKPWWNQSALDALSIGDTAFLAVGDFTVTCQGVCAIVANKDMMTNLGITENIYDMVWEGTWTADRMNSLMELATLDLDGDGKMTGADRYGLLNNSFGHSWQVAMGQPFTARDENGFPRVVMNNERMYSIVETCYNMMTGGSCYMSGYSYASFPESEFRAMMMEGRALFSVLDIGGLYSQLRDIEYNFGLIPLPRLDETQKEYRTFCGAGIVGVPSLLTDAERTGTVLEALAFYSYEYQVPAFFNIVLENKAVRDEESYEMITLIHQSKTYDFGFNLDPSGQVFGMLSTVVDNNKSTDFASYYAAQEKRINKSFDKFFENFQ